MRKLSVVLLLTVSCAFAQTHKSMKKPSAGVPDKAFMQRIFDQWSTLDPANVAQFYASGPHTFFDVAPLKYNSWDEYQSGVKNILSGFKSAKFTVNDDAEVHQHGDLAWGTATIKQDAMMKNGKREMVTARWTVIWENQGGKWLIVHDHASEPIQ